MWKQNVRLLPAPEFLPPGRKFINEEADDEYIRLEEPPNPQEILRWQMSDILNMDVTGWSAAEGNSSEIMRADDERPRTVTREDTAMEISTDPMSWIPVEKSCIPEFLENMNSLMVKMENAKKEAPIHLMKPETRDSDIVASRIFAKDQLVWRQHGNTRIILYRLLQNFIFTCM